VSARRPLRCTMDQLSSNDAVTGSPEKSWRTGGERGAKANVIILQEASHSFDVNHPLFGARFTNLAALRTRLDEQGRMNSGVTGAADNLRWPDAFRVMVQTCGYCEAETGYGLLARTSAVEPILEFLTAHGSN